MAKPLRWAVAIFLASTGFALAYAADAGDKWVPGWVSILLGPFAVVAAPIERTPEGKFPFFRKKTT